MNQPIKGQNQVFHKPLKEVSSLDGLRRLALFALVLTVCFAWPLYQLAGLAMRDDLYSHILLVPFVSLYLIWTNRLSLPRPSPPDRSTALVLLCLGALVFIGTQATARSGINFLGEDRLAAEILSFLFLLIGLSAWILGRTTLRALAFPLAFLIFMVPFPSVMRTGLETFLQHGSAQVAHGLFKLAGTTVFYNDLIFRLRGINLEVAPECSGIRSSLALFITSLLAGHFFLRSPWKCAILTLAVIPLALLRNGFRIFTIGELCVHINPDMINSYIHRHGGPIFFILSLIPFFFLLRLLFKSEARHNAVTSTPHAP